jgi:hypothetical protein
MNTLPPWKIVGRKMAIAKTIYTKSYHDTEDPTAWIDGWLNSELFRVEGLSWNDGVESADESAGDRWYIKSEADTVLIQDIFRLCPGLLRISRGEGYVERHLPMGVFVGTIFDFDCWSSDMLTVELQRESDTFFRRHINSIKPLECGDFEIEFELVMVSSQ